MGKKQAIPATEPEWVGRAFQGDESALPMARQAQEKRRELVEHAGNLVRQAQATLVGEYCGTNA